MKRRFLLFFWLAGSMLLSGCAEPDRRVMAIAGEGDLRLTLEASRDWVRPGDSLPIQVRVESLSGPVQEEVVETIEFVVNNGSVSPSRLVVVLAGPDSLGGEGERQYTAWIVFIAWAQATAAEQGEIYALFRDTVAMLKIRIAPPVFD